MTPVRMKAALEFEYDARPENYLLPGEDSISAAEIAGLDAEQFNNPDNWDLVLDIIAADGAEFKVTPV